MEQALDWARRFLLPGYVVEARCLLTWAGGDRVACAARGFSRAIFLRRADAGTKKIATALILVGEPVGLDKNGPPVSRTDGPHLEVRTNASLPPTSAGVQPRCEIAGRLQDAAALWGFTCRTRSNRARDFYDACEAGRRWAALLSAFA
jgi:hypothetical protein